MRKEKKKGRLAIWLALGFSLGLLALSFTWASASAGLWALVWLMLVCYFLWSSTEPFTRGLILIGGSVLIAFGGRHLIGSSTGALVLDSLQNMMLLVGSGLGGNFMAHQLLEERQAKATQALREAAEAEAAQQAASRTAIEPARHKAAPMAPSAAFLIVSVCCLVGVCNALKDSSKRRTR